MTGQEQRSNMSGPSDGARADEDIRVAAPPATGLVLVPPPPPLTPVGHAIFHPSLRTAGEQMAERTPQEGILRGA